MILRGVLTKILHCADDLGAVLHPVKNDERLFRKNPLAACHHQILQDSIDVLGRLKKLPVPAVFSKVETGRIVVETLPELPEKPCLAVLAHAFQNQRLVVSRGFPLQQLSQDQAFHTHTHHIFIDVLVTFITFLFDIAVTARSSTISSRFSANLPAWRSHDTGTAADFGIKEQN